MKFWYSTCICLLLISCTQTHKMQETNADSISLDSSAIDYGWDIADEEEYLDIDEDAKDAADDSLVSAITNEINKLSEKVKAEGGDYYTINSSFSGYESESESTWYFDSQLNMKYCTGSWGMEGNSGSYSYYFADDDLLAYSAEDFGQQTSETTQFHMAFKPAYGFSKTTSESGEDTKYLDESFYTSTNSSAKDEFRQVLNLIRSNQQDASVTGDKVSIHIASVDSVNFGTEITITEEYSISKILFDKLIEE